MYPYKYGYAQVANSMLKTINFNFKDINDRAILDVGATSHVLVTYASAKGIPLATSPITVTIPDGSKLFFLTHKRTLNLPQLYNAAQTGHVISVVPLYSLMPVVAPYNVGCKVSFDTIGIIVTGLWMAPVTNKATSQEQATFVGNIHPSITNIGVNQQVDNTMAVNFDCGTHFMANAIQTRLRGDLANYHHQSLGSPTM